MKRLILLPSDFPTPYSDCPPGFFLCGDMVGMKTEYSGEGYCDTGETFCRKDSEVTPLKYEWTNE